MAFKKLSVLAVTLAAIFSFSSTSYAAFLNFSIGVPVQFTDDDGESAKSISGTLVHVALPLLPGLGIENYEMKFELSDSDSELTVTNTMYDIFYLLPIPVVNITLGAGIGKAEIKDIDVGGGYKISDFYESSATTTQTFLQVGFPIIPLFDIHVSYHNVSGTFEKKGAATEDMTLKGNMYAIGAAFIF